MTVLSPLTAVRAFLIVLYGFYQCRPVGRRNRENKDSQNFSVAFWLILNKKEKTATMKPQLPSTTPKTLVFLLQLAFKRFY